MDTTKQVDTTSLVRMQFRELHVLGSKLRLDDERQRRVLLVRQQDWPDWSMFLKDGPLPAQPDASIMLRRLGAVTYRLAVLAERQSAGSR
jgi:hypothetical protein